jgi:HSP20 family protein
MDRLFEDFFSPSKPTNGGQRQAMMPTYFLPLDVKEVENGYQIQAPVPGFKPEEVDITLSDGVLRIQAQPKQESSEQQEDYLRKEVAWGNFQRTIQLPADIKEDGISATFENGFLTITVPKAPRPEPKRIQISGKSS